MHLRFTLITTTLAAAITSLAFSTELLMSSTWIAPTSAAFDDAAAWTFGVPGPGDSATFGVTPSLAVFDVTVATPITLGSLAIVSQSPRFIAAGKPGAAAMALDASLVVAGPASSVPSPAFVGVDLASAGPVTVGGGGLIGKLSVEDATFTVDGLDVGLVGSTGQITLGDGGRIENANPSLAWRLGEKGSGAIFMNPGSSLALHGGSMLVGRGSGGFGTLITEANTTIELDGGTLVVGATEPSGPFGGNASAVISGAIAGPGQVIVGRASNGAMVLKSGSSLGEAGDVDLSIGTSLGSGTVTIEPSQAFGHLAVGASGSGSLILGGIGNNTTATELAMGAGGAAQVAVNPGGSLSAGSTLCGPGVTNGAMSVTVGGASFTTESLAFSPTMKSTATFVALGSTGSIALPAIDLHGTQKVLLRGTNGGHITVAAATSVENSGLQCELIAGATVTVNGPMSFEGSGPSHLTLGADGGLLSASTITTGPSCLTSWTLPLSTSPNVGPVSAASVTLNGPIEVKAAPGWVPSGPVDLRLVSAPATSAPQPTTTPTFFGYPAVVRVDESGLLLRIINHIDGFAIPLTIAAAAGESIPFPTIITLDGQTYDVSAQATWSFSPPSLMARTGLTTFMALAGGTGTATVTFGAASVTLACSVSPSLGPVMLLASGTGLTYGNNHSGWDGPGLFTYPFGVGPRSISADGSIVAFTSLANNLVAGDSGNDIDCFLHDMTSGVITAVAPPVPGIPFTAGGTPGLSRDGRYLATAVSATLGGTNGTFTAFLDGTVGVPEIVSVALDGTFAASDGTQRSCVSDDGRFVAFGSAATNLVEGDTNGVNDVFLRDRQLGTTTRASVSPEGSQVLGACTLADLSANGRYVAFLRALGGWKLVYRFDRLTGESRIASPGLIDDTPSIIAYDAQITDDGRFVLFLAVTPEPIVAGPTPIGAQVYCCEVATGVTTMVSVGEDGELANAPIESFAMTSDARFVAMTSKATTLTPAAPGNGNGRTHLVRRDRLTGRNLHVSEVTDGSTVQPFNKDVLPPVAIAKSGGRIAFVTPASNVLPLDTGNHNDVFVAVLPTPPLGDLDGDGVVDAADLGILLGAWGTDDRYDLDGDGAVGASDLAILLGAWSE